MTSPRPAARNSSRLMCGNTAPPVTGQGSKGLPSAMRGACLFNRVSRLPTYSRAWAKGCLRRSSRPLTDRSTLLPSTSSSWSMSQSLTSSTTRPQSGDSRMKSGSRSSMSGAYQHRNLPSGRAVRCRKLYVASSPVVRNDVTSAGNMVAMAGALPLHDIHDEPFPAILASEDDPALRRTGPGYGQQTAQPLRQKRQACPAQRRVAGTAMRTGKHRPVPIHEDLLVLPVIPLVRSIKWKRKDAFHRAALTAALLPLTLVRPRTKNARIPARRPHACHLT